MKKILIMAALTVLLAGCSSEESSSVSPNSPISLGVKAGISNLKTRTGEGIIIGDVFPDQSQIKVLATGDGYDVQSSSYKWSSNKWSTSSQILLVNHLAAVYAYYPIDAETTGAFTNDDSNAIKVYETSATPTSMAGDKDTDFMYAIPTYASGQLGVSNLYPEVNLDFKHALAKLTFIVNKDPDYSWQGVLSSFKIVDSSSPFRSSPTEMYLKDGTFKASQSMLNEKQFVPNDVLYINNESTSIAVTAVVLLYPRTKGSSDTEPTKMVFKIDNKEMELVLNSIGPQTNWTAGYNYVFKVVVKPTGLQLTSVSIGAWNNVESGSVIID